MWVNYKALRLTTSLTKDITLQPKSLLEFIATNTKELYHCYYELEPRDSYVDYSGNLRPAFEKIIIDFDSEPATQALIDTKNFSKKLSSENIPHNIYFSGNKGFHVEIHKTVFDITEGPKEIIESQVKNICYSLTKDYPTIDKGIWNANRKFRAAGSKHHVTGLYKTLLNNQPDFQNFGQWTMEQITKLAEQRHRACLLTLEPQNASPWLKDLALTQVFSQTKPVNTVKTLEPGTFQEDPTWAFRNFKNKKCIEAMEQACLPQFNRHDISLRLIYDKWNRGLSETVTDNQMIRWARKHFSEKDRIVDTSRLVADAYSKPQDYKYGCYDEIKKAYCSAKCALFTSLDPSLRAQPFDMSAKLKLEQATITSEGEKLSEGELADIMLSTMPELIKSGGQYFKWTETHWERIDGDLFEDNIKKAAIEAYQNKASFVKVLSLTKHVIAKIPMAPETNHFFNCSNTKFNFSDCTVEVVTRNGKLFLETFPHNKEDYLAYCAPFPYEASHDLPINGEFAEYLKARESDIGIDGVRILKQILGAAMIPYVPRIVFISGATNSGKSTLALLITKLLGERNISSCLPIRSSSGGRFTWESSLGKLANIVTELDAKNPLDTNTLKMVRDKTPVYIDRKNEKAIKATLPLLHIYCCNEMPNSLEGNSGALNNRVTLLSFKPSYINGKGSITEYWKFIWDNDAGGVLEAAREGLKDLVQTNFKYHVSQQTKELLEDWQMDHDSVALFINDVKNGTYKLTELENEGVEFPKKVPARFLYQDFKKWCTETNKHPMGRNFFNKKIETLTKEKIRMRDLGGICFNLEQIL